MASGYDIGPRIGIEGEKQFKAALQMINSQMKALGSEMSAVTAQFSKQDQSIEKLSQENKILQKTIDAGKQKIAALTAEYDRQSQKLSALAADVEKAKTEFGANSDEAAKAEVAYAKQATAVNKLQTQLNTANGDVAKMTREMQENEQAMNGAGQAADDFSGDMGKAGNAAGKAGKDIGSAGKSSSTFSDVWKGSLVANAISGVASAAKNAADQIKELATQSAASVGALQAKLGVTKNTATDLSAVAKSVWSEGFGSDLDAATDSVALIRQQLGDMSSKDMTQLTKSSLIVQQVFGADVPESVKAARTMMQNFGISGQQAFDLITTGYQNGLDFSGEFLDTLNEYSPQFAKMGMSADDAMKILINGSNQGAFSLDKVADVAKEFGVRIQDGSKSTAEGLSLLGVDADALTQKLGSGQMTIQQAMQLVIGKLSQQKDSVKQNIAGVDLFGTQWEDMGAKAVLAMGTTGGAAQSAMANVEGATARAGDAINNNLGAQSQKAIRGIQSAFEPMAEKMVNFTNSEMPKIQAGAAWLASNAPTIAQGLTSIGLAVATWKITSKIATAKSEMGGFAGAIKSMGAALSANPVGAVITGLILLGTALKAAYDNCAWFRDGVNAAFGAIGTFFHIVWDGIVTFFTTTLPGAWNTVVTFFSGIPAWWSSLWTTVGTTIQTAWGAVLTFFQNLPGNILGFLTQILTNVGTWAASLGQSALQAAQTFGTNFLDFMKNLPYNLGFLLGEAIGTVATWVVNLGQKAIEAGTTFLQNVVNFFTQLPGTIWNFLTQTIPKAAQWVAQMAAKAVQAGTQFLSNVVSFMTQLPGKIWNFLTQAVSRAGTWVGNMAGKARDAGTQFLSNVVSFMTQLPGQIWNFLVQAIQKAAQWVIDMGNKGGEAIRGLISAVVNGAKSIPGQMLSIGRNIVSGIWQGIQNAAGWFRDQVGHFFSGIVDGIKAGLKIHSPSRVFADEIGKYMGLGVGVGFMDSLSTVRRDMSNGLAGLTKGLASSASLVFRPSVNTSGLQLPAGATASGAAGVVLNYTAVYNSPAAPTPSEVNRVNRQNAQRIALMMRRN